MNQDCRQFVVNWLREREYFDKDSLGGGLVGEYALELMETFLDQDHNKQTFNLVPKLFYILYKEMIENDFNP